MQETPTSRWETCTPRSGSTDPQVVLVVLFFTKKGDTILILSDGVTDNICEGILHQQVSKAYTENCTPEHLARTIVSAALTAAYEAKPDDTTCAVGYVCTRELTILLHAQHLAHCVGLVCSI